MQENKTVFQPSMKLLVQSIFSGFVAAIFIFIYTYTLGSALAFVVSLLVFVGIALLSYLNIKNTFVELKENGVQVRRGILAKKQALFLFSEIQDVKETQTFMSMIFSLKSLSIQTMTASSVFGGYVSGLNDADANFIREFVLSKVNQYAAKKSRKESPALAAAGIAGEPDEGLQKNPFPIHPFKSIALVLPLLLVIAVFFVVASTLFSLLQYGFVLLLFPATPFFMWVFGAFVFSVSFRYFLGKTRLEIVQGIFSFYRNNIPFYKVQDILIFRPFLSRLVGLATLKIETGERLVYSSDKQNRGAFLASNSIPWLELKDAEFLKNHVFALLGVNLEEVKPQLSNVFMLEKVKVIKKTIASTISLFILLGAIIGVFAFYSQSLYAVLNQGLAILLAGAFSILVLIFTFKLVHEYYYLKKYYYNVSRDAVVISKGVFSRTTIVVPFRRVENIFVDQDLLDRFFGLYDLHFSTVTNSSAWFSHIDGLGSRNVEEMKKIMSEFTSASMKKN